MIDSRSFLGSSDRANIRRLMVNRKSWIKADKRDYAITRKFQWIFETNKPDVQWTSRIFVSERIFIGPSDVSFDGKRNERRNLAEGGDLMIVAGNTRR